MSASRILLIGDDPNMLRTLRRNLVGRGYDVHIALDDEETYGLASQVAPDLFILNLDFTSIQLDGLEICKQLCTLSRSPIIVLSSVGSEGMKVRALDMGADDYLVMPFGMEEFLARVRSALRRWGTQNRSDADNESRLIFHRDLLINPNTRQALVRGQPVHLTKTEFDILLYLARQGGKVVTHRDILRNVWGDMYGDEREYLRVFVSQLRHKIEDDPLRPVYILTEPGIGYRFGSDLT
jgi:two-component system KDP operon response regulator KdpE